MGHLGKYKIPPNNNIFVFCFKSGTCCTAEGVIQHTTNFVGERLRGGAHQKRPKKKNRQRKEELGEIWKLYLVYAYDITEREETRVPSVARGCVTRGPRLEWLPQNHSVVTLCRSTSFSSLVGRFDHDPFFLVILHHSHPMPYQLRGIILWLWESCVSGPIVFYIHHTVFYEVVIVKSSRRFHRYFLYLAPVNITSVRW